MISCLAGAAVALSEMPFDYTCMYSSFKFAVELLRCPAYDAVKVGAVSIMGLKKTLEPPFP